MDVGTGTGDGGSAFSANGMDASGGLSGAEVIDSPVAHPTQALDAKQNRRAM
jgi:hypothetical protein